MKRRVALGALLLAAVGCAKTDDAPPAREAAPGHGLPASRTVNLYFRRGDDCEVFPVERTANGTRTLDFAWAAMEMLVEGPTEEEAAIGLRSVFPDRDRIWRYSQTRVAFGYDPPFEREEVAVLDVREKDGGVLCVNFSAEIEAFGGGADRVCALIRQIEATGEQFDEYDAVQIAVEGKSRGILQP